LNNKWIGKRVTYNFIAARITYNMYLKVGKGEERKYLIEGWESSGNM
jgi:hypothetical protein